MTAQPLTARIAALPSEEQLRLALRLDAAVTTVNGLAYLVAAGPLEDLLGIDAGLLRGLGAFLLAFSIGVWLTAARTPVSRLGSAAVVVLNLAWAIASVVILALGVTSPTVVGGIWIAMQAAVVAGFAALQWSALRSSRV